jgi:hypothetical protein
MTALARTIEEHRQPADVAGKLAEIARRYRKGERKPVSIAALRIAELRRLFIDRYGGGQLPEDDAGRDDAFIMTCHLALAPHPQRRIAAWLGLWAPWMSNQEFAAAITKAIAKPIRWRADKLGKRLGLTNAERKRLRIRTIGAVDFTKAQRVAHRRLQAREREEQRRRANGVKLRAEHEAASLSATKPWKQAGMSRATWYRRRRKIITVEMLFQHREKRARRNRVRLP